MLVLSRNLHQRIVVIDEDSGNEMTITVARIGVDQIRLGFTGPRAMLVLREELVRRDNEGRRDSGH